MKMDFNKLLTKRVKIVCVFGKEDNSIYYDGIILSYDPEGDSIMIKDKHGKTIYLDSSTIKQVALVEEL